VGIVILVIIVILIVAVAIFAATFDVNRYHGLVQSQLQEHLGRHVSLGNMSLGIFPPRFRVQNISIADDPSFSKAKPFVQAQELDVSVKLLPLLHKDVQINTLNLQRPSVELIKNAQGQWNFSTIGKQQAGTEPSQPAPNKAPQKQPQQKPEPGTGQKPAENKEQLSLGELAISDGQLALTDEQARKPRTVYDHINITLKDFAPDSPFTLDASVHLPGTGAQEIRLQGKGGPINQGDPTATPFHGALDLKGVQIADFQKFLNTPALTNTDGVISGHTNIANEGGKASANGETTISDPKIKGVAVGYPIVANYDVNDDLATDLMRINKATLKLGQTPIDATGTVNMKPTPMQLDLHVIANNVSIAEAARLASAAGIAFPPGTNVTGQVKADVTARGAADKPALNGTVSASNVQATGKDIAQPVQIKAVNLALTPAQINSDNFQVTSGKTAVDTQFSLRNYTSNNPLVAANLRAPQAALPDLLAMAKAYGLQGADKLSGNGVLSLDMHAAGPVKSLNADQLIRALNGTMNLNFANVKYSGADIGHQLAALGKFLPSAQSLQQDKGFTNILKMTGNILVKNGVAQTNNLQALLDIANIGITGTADLASQALNLDINAVLNKAFSQQVGGTGIGGYLNTALSNNQGELVIPAKVTGTFQHPIFAPDVQKLAQMRMKGLIPNGNNPLGGASGVLGNLLGQKNPNQAQPAQGQQQQQQQQNPVNQIIGLFGKKKQNQNQNPPPQK
ncbi:MAG TPA: AsmA family protein, partial [Terriglobales bacterium]|nr:AsmA family protein [Terriglobales bacterium]